MNEIVGGSILGYGFNALGPYDPSSLMSCVFTSSFSQGKTYTYQPTSTTYAVPDNGRVVPYTPVQGGTRVFQSQYDLQSYLATVADISASYGAFSGQVNASYESALEEWGSCYYALTNAWVTNWMVTLEEVDQSVLQPGFAKVLNSLPTTFSTTTQENFFRFFRQYGTHFVHSVAAGGYFSYYEAVENSGTYSFSQVQANVSLEYQAVFTDASGQSSVDWQSLGQSWVQNRIVTISALGGDAHTLNDVTPGFDTNVSTSYTSWINSIENNPSTVQYILRGWDELLPTNSPQQVALQQALHTYMNLNIYVSALFDGNSSNGIPQVVTQGNVVLPTITWPEQPVSTSQGIELVLVDNTTYEPTYSAVYYFDGDSQQGGQALFDQLISDLNSYAEPNNQWCCCSAFNYPWLPMPPDPRLILWLNQFGISGQKWIDNYGNCGGGQMSFNYVALGLWAGLNVSESFSFNSQGVTNINELNINPYLAQN